MYVLAVRINKKHIKTISWEKNLKNYPRFCKLLEINELQKLTPSVKLRSKTFNL